MHYSRLICGKVAEKGIKGSIFFIASDNQFYFHLRLMLGEIAKVSINNKIIKAFQDAI